MKVARLTYSIKKACMRVVNSIAFYPIMIAFGLLALSLVLIHLDGISAGSYLINRAPFLRMDNADTARSLLSSMLTGLIGLVTFTFTMVMIVLTQITSSFSPRVLPDLVSKRGNQIVMGIMIGSIFCIIVVLYNIQPLSSGPEVPALSFL